MDCRIDSPYTDGINCHVYDSLNCKGCCSGGGSSPPRDKNLNFSDESKNDEKCQFPVGICACCKDPPGQQFPKSCQNFGRPVLVYEIPTPKFEGTSTHQRDFGPKPVPVKELPPWHPILKDRWKSLDVPSLNKSTYQSDFTPCVATQECRKPVYLAPKERKDRCQELFETFNTWRKTSKGPSETHEVCDKPMLEKTTVVLREPVHSYELHSHGDSSYRCGNDVKQLHGPECEKHCYSAPLMCHVSSPNSHDERYVVQDRGDGTIYDNTVQYDRAYGKLANTEGHYHRQGLLDCKDVEISPSQRGCNCLDERLVKVEDGNKRLNQNMIYHTISNRHSCQDYAKYPINHAAETCVTMKHPAGDGHGCFSQKERQNLPKESTKVIKHVHFDEEPEVYCGSPTPRTSEIYHSNRPSADAQNFMKSSCLSTKLPKNSNAFTLCEDTNRRSKFWWKNTSCEPQREDVEITSVPQDVTKPSCPSYITIHQHDYTEPCLANYRQSSSNSKSFIEECGCTGVTTEKVLLPQFERGGLI